MFVEFCEYNFYRAACNADTV